MRLIDADALKTLIIEERDKIPMTIESKYKNVLPPEPNRNGESMRGGIRKALRCMENTPTIDPVKHGHWEMYGTAYKCSVCNEGDAFGLTPYCRWCGAKLDEEVSE